MKENDFPIQNLQVPSGEGETVNRVYDGSAEDNKMLPSNGKHDSTNTIEIANEIEVVGSNKVNVSNVIVEENVSVIQEYELLSNDINHDSSSMVKIIDTNEEEGLKVFYHKDKLFIESSITDIYFVNIIRRCPDI